MVTRTRRKWKPDSRGYYSRQIGWELSKSGKLQQHKFLLGTDRKEAERRERKLRELWDTYSENTADDRPLWPDDLLVIAKRIAKGIPEIPIPRGPSERQCDYAARIQRMQTKYPVILFLPEDQHAFEVGQAALELFETVPDPDVSIKRVDKDVVDALGLAAKRLADAGLTIPPELAAFSASTEETPARLFGIEKPGTTRTRPSSGTSAAPAKAENTAAPARAATTEESNQRSVTTRTSGATLHQALRAYEKYLEREYYRPETEQITPWGRTQVRQTKNLRKHHANVLLSKLDADAVGELIGYWRRRPCKIGSKEPMTAKSASNFIGALMRFLKWLDTTSKFDWSKPFAFSDTNTRVRRLPSDHDRKGLEQVDTFNLEELRLLMRYAQPFERCSCSLASTVDLAVLKFRHYSFVKRSSFRGTRRTIERSWDSRRRMTIRSSSESAARVGSTESTFFGR